MTKIHDMMVRTQKWRMIGISAPLPHQTRKTALETFPELKLCKSEQLPRASRAVLFLRRGGSSYSLFSSGLALATCLTTATLAFGGLGSPRRRSSRCRRVYRGACISRGALLAAFLGFLLTGQRTKSRNRHYGASSKKANSSAMRSGKGQRQSA